MPDVITIFKEILLLPPASIALFSPSPQYGTSRQSTIYLSLANEHSSHDPFFFRLLCVAYDLPGGPVKGGVHARTLTMPDANRERPLCAW